MIEAVLLDLDNTLLYLNEKEFMSHYLALLTPKFSDILSPNEFIRVFLKATGTLMRNCGSKTNLEAFLEDFELEISTISRNEILERFESFYSKEFAQIGKICVSNPLANHLTEKLATMKQLKLILATNPVFPRVAVLERLSWAEIPADIFHLITDCEIMHCCKPRTEYFAEVTKMIDIDPMSCLMVGNDRINDMAAGSLGMKTFLVQENQSHNPSEFTSIQNELAQNVEIPPPDFCGSLRDLLLLLNLI
ncbi:MAG: HAD family hydrolase [Candidatus Hodarchaeales archaeon]|jgi:HAD superfamily hydrolase (TIGR01549 family)